MNLKDTKVSIKFTANFVDNLTGNYFTNIPSDLKSFLDNNDGTMRTIVDNLEPNQLYEIEIKIKSIKS